MTSQYTGLRLATQRTRTLPTTDSTSAKPSKTAGAASKWNPCQFTAQDMRRASTKAAEAERTRFATVYGHPASLGRERSAATLLVHGAGWSAAAIVNCLAECPTDAELVRREQSKAAKASAALWNRVAGDRKEEGAA